MKKMTPAFHKMIRPTAFQVEKLFPGCPFSVKMILPFGNQKAFSASPASVARLERLAAAGIISLHHGWQ